MRALARLAAVGALAALLSMGTAALGKPDWAKPHLSKPTPTGAYIAKSDTWLVVYGEVEYSLAPGGGLREEHRYLVENLRETPQSLYYNISFDQSAQELTEVAMNVDRGSHWQKINLKKQSVTATRQSADQVMLTSVEEVEPHRRVALEYTLVERYALLPWQPNFVTSTMPMESLKICLAPGSPETLKLKPVLPEGDAAPETFTPAGDRAWLVRSVPARARIPFGYAAQPGWGDLYPWFVVYNEPRGSQDGSFLEGYAAEWEKATKTQDGTAVASRATALASGAPSPLEKARRIGDFVQHKVQYDDSNENSIHAWVPLEADETLRSLKGDCKGKTLLAQSLLKAVGLESRPVLLRMDDDYFSWRAEPATSRLNHVILAVRIEGESSLPATLLEGPAAGWVLFDPVLETAAFGEPLPGYEGLPALLVGGGGQPRFTIRTKVPSAERFRANLNYAVDGSGGIVGTLTLKDNGASWLMRRLATTFDEQDIVETVQHAFPASLNRVQIRRVKVRRAGEAGATLMEAEVAFALAGAAQSMASGILLENPLALTAHLAGIPNGYWPVPPASPDDRIEVSAPWDAKKNAHGTELDVEVEVAVDLPQGFAWTAPPERRETTPALEYSCAWVQQEEGLWKGTLKLARHRGSWPAADRKARLKLEDGIFTGLYKSLELQKK